MTNWDNVVEGKELNRAKNKRRTIFVDSKERKGALPDLEEEGWRLVSTYADNKFVKVRKEKLHDEQFEDKIWMLFYQMGFKYMNKDRNFVIHYKESEPKSTQQIDIFAADDETVLIVECKSAEAIKEGFFKKEIEALHGQMDGIRKIVMKKYPNRKVKFIWATHNYIMNKADIDRLECWGIEFFSDSTVQYYSELVKHLGQCARYQLLGNLLANTEIKNMDNLVPAIKGKMGGHEYYEFSIQPEKLLKIGYVLHRSEANKNMMPTYQRLIKKNRLKSVNDFVNEGGYFPNSLIISIDTQGKGVVFDQSDMRVKGAIAKLGVLHLPKVYHSAYIIDGQHRLYGYSNSKYASTNTIPVVAFIDLDRSEQLRLFMEINENQKSVSKTLRVTLNSDLLWDSKNKNEQREALRSKIAQMCGEEQTSPLLGRVFIGEDDKSSMKCITIEAIQAALKKCHFLTIFNKKNEIVMDGTFDLGENDSTCILLYTFIERCLKYIKSKCESEWEKGKEGILTINRGIQAIIRVIDDIVQLLLQQGKISPKSDTVDSMVAEVEYYLQPLVDYFNSVTVEQSRELSRFVGGAADNKFWHTFQKVIASERVDFCPDGLSEFIENESQQYNNESRNYLRDIEKIVKDKIEQKLSDYYGENWFLKGVPKSLYKRANSMADEKKYDLISKDEETDVEIEPWDCIGLKDCKDIITYASNWKNIFEPIFTQPDQKRSSKENKTEWIAILGKEVINLNKASYSVPKEKFELISDIRKWLGNEE